MHIAGRRPVLVLGKKLSEEKLAANSQMVGADKLGVEWFEQARLYCHIAVIKETKVVVDNLT